MTLASLWWRPALAPVRVGAPLLWAGGLWWLSAQEGRPSAGGFGMALAHNAGHVVLFGTLAALLLLARPRLLLQRSWWWTCLALSATYAVVDEWHQAFVPGRASSGGDVVTDVCAAAAALTAIVAMASGRPRAWRLCGLLTLLALGSALVETLR